MFDVFGSLRSLIKTKPTVIDNGIFRLHYQFTSLVLLAFSALVTSRQYFGDPINCINNDDVPKKVLQTFCWIHTTFTLPRAFVLPVGEDGIAHPGVDKYRKGDERTFHAYYQWVCFVLFIQAILFYVPRYLWKVCEHGKVKCLTMGLDSPILSPNIKKQKKEALVTYLRSYLHYHTMYISYYVICEWLNLINVIGQMALIDAFLGGYFWNFGTEVIDTMDLDQDVRNDTMVKVFPRITKCTFNRYGSSGDVMKYDALCILPMNIINEKIYVYLWFWLVILLFLSSLMVVYRLILIFWPPSRYYALRARARLVDHRTLSVIMDYVHFGDWFLLYLLSKNVDPVHFKDIMTDFAKSLDEDGVKLLDNKYNGQDKPGGFGTTSV